MLRRCALVAVVGCAAIAAAADPAKPGRFAVGVATVDAVDTSRARTLPTEIWYPARDAGRDAALLPRAFPLVLVAHGFCGARTNYDYVAAHLASHGFLVAAPDFVGVTRTACDAGQVTADVATMALDLSYVCRTLHDVTGPLAKWAQHVRGMPTGLVGHSLGGRAAVEAVRIDPAFTATVGLAPAAAAADAAGLADLAPRRAWLVAGGTADTLVSFDGWTQPFFAGLPAPAYLVRIADGTHGGFSDADPGRDPAALAAQQTLVTRYATAFFVRHLARKKKHGRWLRDAETAGVAVDARPR